MKKAFFLSFIAFVLFFFSCSDLESDNIKINSYSNIEAIPVDENIIKKVIWLPEDIKKTILSSCKEEKLKIYNPIFSLSREENLLDLENSDGLEIHIPKNLPEIIFSKMRETYIKSSYVAKTINSILETDDFKKIFTKNPEEFLKLKYLLNRIDPVSKYFKGCLDQNILTRESIEYYELLEYFLNFSKGFLDENFYNTSINEVSKNNLIDYSTEYSSDFSDFFSEKEEESQSENESLEEKALSEDEGYLADVSSDEENKKTNSRKESFESLKTNKRKRGSEYSKVDKSEKNTDSNSLKPPRKKQKTK